MIITAISYGDERFSQSLKYNLKTAKKYGKADFVIAYGPNDIDKSFKEKNKEIMSAKKGAGYWLWKPYIISKALEKCSYGDCLVYSDSGTFYMNDINSYIEIMKKNNESIYIGEVNFLEKEYSKRDAFVYIGVDKLGYENTKQLDASFIMIIKTKKTENIIREWLHFCCDKRIISDDDNQCKLDNYEGFIENRYDQTVLSLVLKKNNVIPLFNVSQPNPYFTCVEIMTLFGRGKYIDFLKKEKTQLYKKWKNEEYTAPLIVRTRFRNMNKIIFVVKIFQKRMRYIYRNKVSFFLTKIYACINKMGSKR